jgi:hypothetical protein
MDISHFELIWKPQAPANPAGTPAVATVLQGYFLEITNLESVPYSYRIEFVASPVTDPARSLAGNTVVFVDTPGANNTPGILNGTITDTVFTPSTGLVTVPPLGTALVALLPQAFGPAPGDPNPLPNTPRPNFEVRGHVRIRLPATFRRVGNFFLLAPQANAPVRVMLTPQNRATFFTDTGAVDDQTQATLPLADGKATILLPADPAIFFPLEQVFNPARLAALDPAAVLQPEAVMASLAMLGAAGDDIAPVNGMLEEAGINLVLSRRKRK